MPGQLEHLDLNNNKQVELTELQKKMSEGFFDKKENVQLLVKELKYDEHMLEKSFKNSLDTIVQDIAHKKIQVYNTQWVLHYTQWEICLMQLWAHTIFDDPIIIDGNRGWTRNMQSKTNMYIYRAELTAQFPNAWLLLSQLSLDQWKSAIREYFTVYNKVRISGSYFEKKIPPKAYESLLINIINNIKNNSSNIDIYSKFIASLSGEIVDTHTQHLIENNTLKVQQYQKKLDLIKDKNSENALTLKKDIYLLNLASADLLGSVDLKRQIMLSLASDFDNTSIVQYFGSSLADEIDMLRKTLSDEVVKYDLIHDVVTQVQGDGNMSISRDVSRDEYKMRDPSSAAFLFGQSQTFVAESTGVSSNTNHNIPKVPSDIVRLRLPGVSENIIVKWTLNFNEQNTYEKVLKSIKPWEKILLTQLSGSKGITSLEDGASVRYADIGISSVDKNGTIIVKNLDGTIVHTISKQESDKATGTFDMAVNSMVTPELKNAMDALSDVGKDMQSINDIYSLFSKDGITEQQVLTAQTIAKNFVDTKLLWLSQQVPVWQKTQLQLQSLIKNIDKLSITSVQEQKIKDTIAALDTLITQFKVWPNGQSSIGSFLDTIVNAKTLYANDKRYNALYGWIKNNGLQTLGAIVGAVVAIVLFVPSGWASSLLLVAAIGAGGGMVGSRFGQIGNEWLHNNVFDTKLPNGKSLNYDNPTDIELWAKDKLSTKDFAVWLASEFVLWTVSTFGFMKAGQLIGKSLSGYAAAHPESRFTSFLKLTKPIFRNIDDWHTQQLFASAAQKTEQSMFQKIIHETWQELAEEWAESTAEKVRGPLGTLVTIWNCLTPSPKAPKLFADHKVSIRWSEQIGNDLILTMQYQSTEVTSLIDHFTTQGFISTPEWNNVVLSKPVAWHPDGLIQKIVLEQTQEPLVARMMDIQSHYPSMVYNNIDWSYDVSQLNQTQLTDLQNNLQKYFVINHNNDGTWSAVNGSDVLVFSDVTPNGNNTTEQIPTLPIQFTDIVNTEEIKNLWDKALQDWLIVLDGQWNIADVFVEVWGVKKPSLLFETMLNNGLSKEQALKTWLQVRTQNFKNWFGDWQNNPSEASKVVDNNGEPLLCTRSELNKFETFEHAFVGSFRQNNGEWPIVDWFYFAPGYTQNNYGWEYMMYTFLNIKNPLSIIDLNGAYKNNFAVFIQKTKEMFGLDISSTVGLEIRRQLCDYYNIKYPDNISLPDATKLRFMLEQLWYDGMFSFDNIGEDIAVFDNHNIKSAVDNNWSFDPTNPNIYDRANTQQEQTEITPEQEQEIEKQIDEIVAEADGVQQELSDVLLEAEHTVDEHQKDLLLSKALHKIQHWFHKIDTVFGGTIHHIIHIFHDAKHDAKHVKQSQTILHKLWDILSAVDNALYGWYEVKHLLANIYHIWDGSYTWDYHMTAEAVGAMATALHEGVLHLSMRIKLLDLRIKEHITVHKFSDHIIDLGKYITDVDTYRHQLGSFLVNYSHIPTETIQSLINTLPISGSVDNDLHMQIVMELGDAFESSYYGASDNSVVDKAIAKIVTLHQQSQKSKQNTVPPNTVKNEPY